MRGSPSSACQKPTAVPSFSVLCTCAVVARLAVLPRKRASVVPSGPESRSVRMRQPGRPAGHHGGGTAGALKAK